MRRTRKLRVVPGPFRELRHMVTSIVTDSKVPVYKTESNRVPIDFRDWLLFLRWLRQGYLFQVREMIAGS